MPVTRATLLIATVLLMSCHAKGPVQPHDSITANAEPLRSAFNADSGIMRAIFLASPT